MENRSNSKGEEVELKKRYKKRFYRPWMVYPPRAQVGDRVIAVSRGKKVPGIILKVVWRPKHRCFKYLVWREGHERDRFLSSGSFHVIDEDWD